ncbi:LppP/LprE family lipoprotein [Tomitella fengzijianii]|uniref:LppP/LprE family lipoprotein n=1 Tax=Tomitella fengzijianii TaxID=2597660 RepID=UPI00131B00CA|nr:LppP/LprE family lipoprotein [Tomitella fengzijianii]
MRTSDDHRPAVRERRGPSAAAAAVRHPVAVASALALAGLLAGCGSGGGGPAEGTASPVDSGVQATETAAGTTLQSSPTPAVTDGSGAHAGSSPGEAAPAPVAGPSAAPAGGGSGGGPQCGVDPSAPAIAQAVQTLSQNQPSRYGWTYVGESNYDPCVDLSYAMAETPGATASSPMQLMLFHQGAYVGTGTLCAMPYTSVIGTADDEVDVRYRWLRGDEASADPSGEATTSYVWTGDGVRMTRPLPEEAQVSC